MKKKVISTMLAAAMIMSEGYSASAIDIFIDYAGEEEIVQTADAGSKNWFENDDILASLDSYTGNLSDKNETAILNKFYDAAMDLSEDAINISSYNVTLDELKVLLQRLFFVHPDLFYVKTSFSYSGTTSHVAAITFKYDSDASQRIDEFNQNAEEIKDIIDYKIKEGNVTKDLQKAIIIHDVICSLYAYDYNYQNYSAETMMRDGVGVCQAYTEMYTYMLSLYGISSEASLSTSMNHAWNMVYLNSEYYQIDLTWDDELPTGKIGHTYALLTDNAFQYPSVYTNFTSNSSHYGWDDIGKYATDDLYIDREWHNAISEIIPLDGYWYYINTSGQICCYNYSSDTETVVYTIPSSSYTSSQTWRGTYCGLGEYNGTLYFNTPSGANAVIADGTKKITNLITTDSVIDAVKSMVQIKGITTDLYGLSIMGNTLKVSTGASPKATMKDYTLNLSSLPTTAPTTAPRPTPAITQNPSSSPIPEVSSTPEVSPTPEISPTPTVSPTPTPTIEPQVIATIAPSQDKSMVFERELELKPSDRSEYEYMLSLNLQKAQGINDTDIPPQAQLYFVIYGNDGKLLYINKTDAELSNVSYSFYVTGSTLRNNIKIMLWDGERALMESVDIQ